jgi:Ca2+-binding RTX toxin-like protein
MPTINILPANSSTPSSTINLPEGLQAYGADTVIATLSVDGAAVGETFTYALGAGLDTYFGIDVDKLYVKAGVLFDFESLTTPLFNLEISATSQATEEPSTVETAQAVVSVTDVNEAPTDITMTGGKVAENSVAGTTVAYLSAVDPDKASDKTIASYAFVTDETGTTTATSDYFTIVGTTIKLKAGLDNAQVGTHDFWVKVTDKGGLSYVEKVTITVANSPEVINGTSKNDNGKKKLNGTADHDIINGYAGNDELYGHNGNDLLSGGSGVDFLFGGNGDDVLNGGSGKDALYGGDGKDTFVFDAPVKKGEFDHIKHFVSADDTIQFSLATLKAFKVKDHGKSVSLDKIFKKGKKMEKKFFDVGSKDNDADQSNDYIYYNKNNGKVFLDIDGSGKAKGIEILKLKSGTSLSADDFLFI